MKTLSPYPPPSLSLLVLGRVELFLSFLSFFFQKCFACAGGSGKEDEGEKTEGTEEDEEEGDEEEEGEAMESQEEEGEMKEGEVTILFTPEHFWMTNNPASVK